MQLSHILVFVIAALLLSALTQGRPRGWILAAGNVLALFWLQPSSPIRHLDFWLPVVTISLALFVWLTLGKDADKNDAVTLLVILATVVGVDLLRYARPLCCITATRPPQIWLLVAAAAAIASIGAAFRRWRAKKTLLGALLSLSLIALLVILKTPTLAHKTSEILRSLMSQSTQQASAFDIRWLGISYVFFRLVSTLREHQTGRLPEFTLAEFVNYVLFFPTIVSGPIQQPDAYLKTYRCPFKQSWQNLYVSFERIIVGMFKKYALADTLALIALDDVRLAQTDSTLWLWVMLYAYVYRIYFDFSGYTDIAIGLARLMGVSLPENFDKPFRKINLTAFWNSWHITLAMWFRAYYFNPVSRRMIARWKRIPTPVLIAASQITTMILIGLWHGVTPNFFVWGVWHGAGLFIHNRWANLTRTRLTWLEARPRLKSLTDGLSVLLTFHYVVLSCIWFALSQTAMSWEALQLLVGAR
jgi:alginate O-acetyltransferase complex protein AlgI